MNDTFAVPRPVARERSALFWAFIVRLPTLWQSLTWLPGYLLLFLLTDLRVKGEEHIRAIPKGTPLLLAANHESDLDGVALLSAFSPFHARFPLYYVARARKDYVWTNPLRKLFYRGWFFWLIGAFPIQSKTGDYATALSLHEELLRRGRTVVIFPEGGFGKGVVGRRPARGGVAYLAQKTGAHILPVYIRGAEHMGLSSLFSLRHTLTVEYKKPITPTELQAAAATDPAHDPYHAAAEKILDSVYANA
jgi:1-acyl-sn-glycerol-3-phosphate acyltransferase